jgi:2-polyprenyl-3-methyl-5-hydroxy-6-metoxy-1,4-benzoquinol methylase
MKYYRENYDIDKICPLWVDYQVVQLIKPNSVILEIGCATGYIGKFLKEKRNCTMFAVEIDKEAAEVAKPYYEKIIIGDVEDEKILEELPPKFFDYILCMNVLEHLRWPQKVLAHLKKFLKPEGSVIVAIPNVAHWSIRLKLLFGDFEYGKGLFGTDHGIALLDETHLRFFTKKTMLKMFYDAGYKVVFCRFDPDKGIPKLHGLLLQLPYGWKLLKFIYSLWPTLFAGQFIFELKIRR